jgi:hypothetical protein
VGHVVREGSGGKRLGDEATAIVDAVQRDEAAHARALRRAEQRLVQRLEPVAQAFERIALADLEDDVLDLVSRGGGIERGKLRIEVAKGVDLMADRGARATSRSPSRPPSPLDADRS